MPISMAVILSIFIVLPFLLAYVHTSINKTIAFTLLSYRYFIIVNIVLAGLFVAGRMFLDGQTAAQVSGWSYSPVFHLYGIAILSIAIAALITVFCKSNAKLVPALIWTIFVVLSSVSHIYNLTRHMIEDSHIIVLHIIYNSVVAIALIFYMVSLHTDEKHA